MSAHPKAFIGLVKRLKRATDPEVIDQLLDQWIDYETRATEWDARQWGFDPTRWMEEERAELERRAQPPQSTPITKKP